MTSIVGGKMFIIIILILTPESWSLKEAQFVAIAVFKDSLINTPNTNEVAMEYNDVNGCAQLCLMEENCNAFSIRTKDGSYCRFENSQGLIPMIGDSGVAPARSKVWLKNANASLLAPHFLVINMIEFTITDFSPGPRMPMTPNAWPASVDTAYPTPYIYFPDDMILIVQEPKSKDNFIRFNLKDQVIEAAPELRRVSRENAASAVKNNILFICGGVGRTGSADALFDGKTWKTLRSFNAMFENGCATFAPDSNSTVYLIGGLSGYYYARKEVWAYDFNSDAYTLVGNLPIGHDGIANLACLGFLYGPEQRPAIMILGGEYYNAGLDWTISSSTYVFFPDDLSMVTMTDLTFGLKLATLLQVDEEIWSFGGGYYPAVGGDSYGYGARYGGVMKILPAEGASWTSVGTMGNGEVPGWNPVVARLV